MLRRFSANFAVLSIFLDLVVSSATLYMAAMIRPWLSGLSFVQVIPSPVVIPHSLYFIFPVMWVGVLMLFAVYDGRKNLKAIDEFGSLTFGSLLAGVAMAGVLYLSYREISRALFASYILMGYMLMLGWRVIVRIIFRVRRGKTSQQRLLIVGAGPLGNELTHTLQEQAHDNLALIGFLEDAQADGQSIAGMGDLPYLGGLPDVRKVVRDQQVDDVLIALPRSANGRLDRVISEMHDLPVRVWVALDYYSLALHHARVDEFAGIPMLDLRAPALNEYQRMIKRAFDLILCILVLPFLLPLTALIALLIKLDDHGPVFYNTPRAGENGRIFRMFKFRTMVVDADQQLDRVTRQDENGQLFYKTPADPRVTRIGKLLRRTSLDELPQIFNVIKGEMSIVGPRPEMPWLVEKYDLWQRTRFAVPQGITGWWQVNGRSDKPMHLHTEEDMYYIQHYSIWMDIRILLKTFWAVLRGKGAY